MDNQIGIIITGTNNSIAAFQRLKGDLDAVAVSAQTVTKSQREMTMQGRDATTQNRALSQAAKASNTAFRQHAIAVRQSRVAIARWGTQADKAARGARSFAAGVDAGGAALAILARGAVGATRAVILQAASLERLKLGLRTLSPTIAEANAQYGRLIEVARLPGIDLTNALKASNQLVAIGIEAEKATRIIQVFGNALALSGASTFDIQRTIYGLRQLIADGVVLQRELNLITSRVPVATPILRQEFEGVRAEDVRSFFDEQNVPRSEQATRFIEILTNRLEELPSAAETTANALENMSDTFSRVQAAVGENFLPAVNQATMAVERLLFAVEDDRALRRSTASFLSFSTAMVGTTATVLGLARVIPLLGGLLTPIGAIAVGVGVLAGTFVNARVEAARLDAQTDTLGTNVERLRELLRFDDLNTSTRGLDTVVDNIRTINSEVDRLLAERESAFERARGGGSGRDASIFLGSQNLERIDERFQVQFEGLIEAGRTLDETFTRISELGGAADVEQLGRTLQVLETTETRLENLTGLRRELAEQQARGRAGVDADDILAQDSAYQRLISRLTNLRDVVGQLALRQAVLNREASELPSRVDAAFQGLADAASGTSAEIANALQTLESITEGANDRVRDLALDLGVQLIGIAEATTSGQVDAVGRRTEALARDNSQIIAEEERLQSSLQAVRDRVQSRLQSLRQDELTLAINDETGEQISNAQIAFLDLEDTVAQVAKNAELGIARSVEGQAQAFLTQYRFITDGPIQSLIDKVQELRAANQLLIEDIENAQFQDAFTLETQDRVGQGLSQALTALQGFEDQLASTGGRTFEEMRDNLNDVRSEGTRLIETFRTQDLGLSDSGVLEFIGRIETGLENIQTRVQDIRFDELSIQVDTNAQNAFAGARQALARQQQQDQRAADDAIRDLRRMTLLGARDTQQELGRIQDRFADARSVSQLSRLRRDNQRFLTESRSSARQLDALLGDVGRVEFELIGADQAQAQTQRLIDDAETLGTTLEAAIQQARVNEFIDDFRDGLARVASDVVQLGFDFLFDSLTGSTDKAAEALGDYSYEVDGARHSVQLLVDDVTRLNRLNEDTVRGVARLREDRARAERQIRFRIRETAASQPFGDQRGIQRNIARQQDQRFRLRERLEDFDVRIQRFGQDAALRQSRLIEDATRNRDRTEAPRDQTGFLEQLGRTITDAITGSISDRIGGFIADALTGALPGLLGDLFGLGGEEAAEQAMLVVSAPEGGLKLAVPDAGLPIAVPTDGLKLNVPMDGLKLNLAGALSAVTAATDVTLPMIGGLEGTLAKVTLSEAASLPPVTGLTGGIQRVVLQMNADLPIVPGLVGGISSVTFADDIDTPNLPAQALNISSIAFAEGVTPPALSDYTALISSLAFAEGVSPPALPTYAGVIASLGLAEGVTAPALPAYEALIGSVAFAQGVASPNLPAQSLLINSVAFSDDIDYPNIPAQALNISSISFAEGVTPPALSDYTALISSLAFAEGVSPPALPAYAGVIASLGLAEGVTAPALPAYEALIGSVAFAQGVASPNLPAQSLLINSVAFSDDIDYPNIPAQALNISSIGFAEGVSAPALPAYEALIGSIGFAEDIDYPSLPQQELTIASVSFAEGVVPPVLDAYDAIINSIKFAEDIDYPSIPQQELAIASASFAEGVTPPALPTYDALIGSIGFAEGVAGLSVSVAGIINALTLEGTIPAVTGLSGQISDLTIATGEDAPNPPSVDGISGIIDSLSLAEGATAPSIAGITGVVSSLTVAATTPALAGLNAAIENLTISPDIDPPTVTGLDGRIDDITISPDIDPPTVTGLAGRIDDVTISPDIDPPTIRVPGTVVVGPVTGEREGTRGTGEKEDPPNPMLATQEIDGVINASLNKLFAEPVQIAGVINATVVRGAGGGGGGNQGGDGGGDSTGGDKDPVEVVQVASQAGYDDDSQVAQDIATIANAVTDPKNVNLNPALGPTPTIDIPDVLDRLNRQTDQTRGAPINAGGPGFADVLGAHSQFRPGGGGAGGAPAQSSLRVAFPREALIGLANIAIELASHTRQWEGANQHLATIRTTLANNIDFATETTLDRIATATEKTAAAPVVEALLSAGIGSPFSAGSPTPNADALQAANAAELSQAGFSLLGQLSAIPDGQEGAKGLESIRELMASALERPAGTADDPLYVQALEGGLDVNIVNKEDINVKVNNADDIGVQVNNEEPIRVETGVVTIVIGETPVSVRIEDLGALLNQLSNQNTASDSFGGQTI